MPTPGEQQGNSFQQEFHQRWKRLTNQHVRTLAWLLAAPDLLDASSPLWNGRIATLGPATPEVENWLVSLDRSPEALTDYLDLTPLTRLGRYAEKLMAFFLMHQGLLFAHGVQVRADKGETIGEFDFIVREGEALVHWEFATKLYLLESSGKGQHADYFVGPNLADTLGAKIRKIMDRQLSLSQHPAAQSLFPHAIAAARALIKGWLFYRGKPNPAEHPQGVSSLHCSGFWRPFEELDEVCGEHFLVLPRLSWLAPARASHEEVCSRQDLRDGLARHFDAGGAPVLVAILAPQSGEQLETDRGFIVPNDWHSRAGIHAGRALESGSR